MSYVLTVMTYKKGESKKPNNDIENHIEEDRWDYRNECNEWEGGGFRNNYKPKCWAEQESGDDPADGH